MSERTNRMTAVFDEIRNVFSPLTVGSEKFFEDAATMLHNVTGYPPYNVLRGENETIIEVSLAGLGPEDIEVFIEKNILHVTHLLTNTGGVEKIFDGSTSAKKIGKAMKDIQFDLHLNVAEGIFVDNAHMKNGLLRLCLKRADTVHAKKVVEVTVESV